FRARAAGLRDIAVRPRRQAAVVVAAGTGPVFDPGEREASIVVRILDRRLVLAEQSAERPPHLRERGRGTEREHDQNEEPLHFLPSRSRISFVFSARSVSSFSSCPSY